MVERSPEQPACKASAIACYAGEIEKVERVFGSITDEEQLRYEGFSATRRGARSAGVG